MDGVNHRNVGRSLNFQVQNDLENAVCNLDVNAARQAIAAGADPHAYPLTFMPSGSGNSVFSIPASPSIIKGRDTTILGQAVRRVSACEDLIDAITSGRQFHYMPIVAIGRLGGREQPLNMVEYIALLNRNWDASSERSTCFVRTLECLDFGSSEIRTAAGMVANQELSHAKEAPDDAHQRIHFHLFCLLAAFGGELSSEAKNLRLETYGDKISILAAAVHLDASRPSIRNQLIRNLIRAGCDPNSAATRTGQTPLMMSVYMADKVAINALLEGGADLLQKDGRGYTAMSWAKRSKEKREMVAFLSSILAKKAVEAEQEQAHERPRPLD